MKKNRFSLITLITVVISLVACNDRGTSTGTAADTSLTDTRRNSTDTVNYLQKDSGNKSQETIDMNPAQNSRY